MKTSIRNKTAPALLILMILLGSLTTFGQNDKIKKPFPPEISKKIKFGMSKNDFLQLYPNAEITHEESFRTVIILDLESDDVENLICYFGTKGTEPLYEIIVNFKSESLAESKAQKLLKQPNHEDGEWRYMYKKEALWCWVYKTKIVYVARIPDTEWYSEWDSR